MDRDAESRPRKRSPQMDQDDDFYDVAQMSYLDDLEHVRARAGTYIGDLGTHGLHHLVHEVIDNSLDEAMAGYADRIEITIHNDGSISVKDNGRGIPVATDPRVGKSALECVMTLLKYGGKFEDSAYKRAGGLNGMGMKAVNFLSAWCVVQVARDGQTHQQSYRVGKPEGPVEVVGPTSETGTQVSFLPDPDKFGGLKFDSTVLQQRAQTAAFLNPGVAIHFSDQRSGTEFKFHYQRGLVEWIEYHQNDLPLVHDKVIHVSGSHEEVEVSLAFRYHLETNELTRCFANNILNEEGGTHLSGFRTALTRSLMAFAKRENAFDAIVPIAQDLREGLTAIVSVRLSQPQFDSQHKIKLTSAIAEKAVQSVAGNYLKKFWEENPRIANSILAKAVISARARVQAKEVRKRLLSKSKTLGGLPGKLRDCTSKDPTQSELYLVEGDSAGGSAEGGRVREFQAILPLRGKIINAYKSSLEKVLSNVEVQSIIQAVGIGVGPHIEMEKLRYHKIIIMSDADVDGSHIRTLLLCFFYRQFPQLINRGHVFVAEPPLYRVRNKSKNEYIQNDRELKDYLFARGVRWSKLYIDDIEYVGRDLEAKVLSRSSGDELKNGALVVQGKPFDLGSFSSLEQAVRAAGETGLQITRFKGLGEMNAEELRHTTLLPEKRKLVRITMEDAQRAQELFHLLMGVSVEPRRKFIEQHALSVKNLDI